MNCQDVKKIIQAYSDGELDATHSLSVEEHLRGCTGCASAQRGQLALKSTLSAGAMQFKSPPGLRRQVVTELRRTLPPEPEPRPSFWAMFSWQKFAVPALAILLVGLFFLNLPTRFSSSYQLVGEITSSHVRSMMPNHLMDVVSTDQHTVKPWFDGKVDFAPPVKDFATQGFPLAGGRLEYLDGHSAAALIYMRQKHIINLYIWPVTTETRPPGTAITRNGYHLIHWTDGGMKFWAVSDLNEKELMQFAEMFHGN